MNRFSILMLTVITLIASAFVSCSKDEGPYCTVDKSEVYVGTSLGVLDGFFNITSNTMWTVSSNADWIIVVTTNGEGNGEVELRLESNDNPNDRTGTVSVVSEGGIVNVSITQKQMDVIDIMEAPGSFTWKGGSATFSINANIDYKVSTDCNWITVRESTTKALEKKSYSIDVLENRTAVTRSATIHVTDGKLTKNITISQDKYVVLESMGFKSLYYVDGCIILDSFNRTFSKMFDLYYLPEEPSEKDLTWSVSDPEIATIDPNTLDITTYSKRGIAELTVTDKISNVSETVKLKVQNGPVANYIEPWSQYNTETDIDLYGYPGAVAKSILRVDPSNADIFDMSITSTVPSVVNVTDDGLLHFAYNEGDAVITYSLPNGVRTKLRAHNHEVYGSGYGIYDRQQDFFFESISGRLGGKVYTTSRKAINIQNIAFVDRNGHSITSNFVMIRLYIHENGSKEVWFNTELINFRYTFGYKFNQMDQCESELSRCKFIVYYTLGNSTDVKTLEISLKERLNGKPNDTQLSNRYYDWFVK